MSTQTTWFLCSGLQFNKKKRSLEIIQALGWKTCWIISRNWTIYLSNFAPSRPYNTFLKAVHESVLAASLWYLVQLFSHVVGRNIVKLIAYLFQSLASNLHLWLTFFKNAMQTIIWILSSPVRKTYMLI